MRFLVVFENCSFLAVWCFRYGATGADGNSLFLKMPIFWHGWSGGFLVFENAEKLAAGLDGGQKNIVFENRDFLAVWSGAYQKNIVFENCDFLACPGLALVLLVFYGMGKMGKKNREGFPSLAIVKIGLPVSQAKSKRKQRHKLPHSKIRQ